MKAQIKLPRSRTGAMLLLQQYATSGHVHWLAGTIAREKMRRFAAKVSASYSGVHRDAPGRRYDRTLRRASVHFVVLPLDDETAFWALVSTGGKGGLADPNAPDLGCARDMRLRGQALTFLHYELLLQEKRLPGVAGSTWTWRIAPTRYRELEAQVVQTARERSPAAVQELITMNSAMPLFSGVRGQVLKLNAMARKLVSKFQQTSIDLPSLPFMRRQRIYAEPPQTLDAWLIAQTPAVHSQAL